MLTRLILFLGVLALAASLPTLNTEMDKDIDADDAVVSLSEQLLSGDASDTDDIDLQAGQFMRKGVKAKYGSKYKGMTYYKYKHSGYKSSYYRHRHYGSFYVYGMYGYPYGYHRHRYGRHQRSRFTRPGNSTEHLPTPQKNSSVVVLVRTTTSTTPDEARKIRDALWRIVESNLPLSPLVKKVKSCLAGSSLETCLDQYLKVYFEKREGASFSPTWRIPEPCGAFPLEPCAEEDLQMDAGSNEVGAFPSIDTASQTFGWAEVLGEGREEAAVTINHLLNVGGTHSEIARAGIKTGPGSSVLLESPAPALSPACSAAIAVLMASLVLLI